MLYIKNVFFAVFVVIAVSGSVFAQNTQTVAAEDIVAPSVEEEGIVVLYGQRLNPGAIKVEAPLPWPAYDWSLLSGHVAELFPDAEGMTKSPEVLCDDIVDTYYTQGAKVEEAEYPVIAAAASLWGDDAPQEVIDRLSSSSDVGVAELLEKLPDHKAEILRLREMTVKMLALVFLRDAAVKNCPDHAREKDYPLLLSPYEEKQPGEG